MSCFAVSDKPIELLAGGSYQVKALFPNPLSKSLTNLMFYIEGAKLTKSQKKPGRYVYMTTMLLVLLYTCRSTVIIILTQFYNDLSDDL